MIGIKVPPRNVTESAPVAPEKVQPMSRADVKAALQIASVDVAKGEWLTVRELTMRTAGLFPEAGLRFSELEALWSEIATDRLAGVALDVPAYVPPPEPVKPKPPKVIDYDEPPDPKEVPDEE